MFDLNITLSLDLGWHRVIAFFKFLVSQNFTTLKTEKTNISKMIYSF